MSSEQSKHEPVPPDEADTPPGERSNSVEAAPFPIVGTGASAGGLEAFTELLRHLPLDTGMAFVLVQHLDPQHESALTQLLMRATSLPVREVTNNLPVEPNHVYVIPPNMNLAITQGVLKLQPRQPTRAPHHSIDFFFESLARDQRERAMGVILSGTASDGTLGLEAIKAEGGITFAQDDSARYDSMPRSAITARCVDFVLSPENIAKELDRIAKHPYVAGQPLEIVTPAEDDGASATVHEDDQTALPSGGPGTPRMGARPARAEGEAARGKAGDNGFKKILLLLRNHSGVDFSLYKSSTIQRRITRRMVLNKQDRLERYADFLRSNAKELDALYSDALISVTSFFRNPDAFAVLKRKVFPKLLQQRGDDPIRVWVLGCSTGQEAYSIAMALLETAEKVSRLRRLQVFATDLNEALLDKARHGLYSKSLAQDVSPERLRRFFVEEEGGYRIVKPLREMVVFAGQNLITDPPFSRMDLISCRNLLIYLEPSLQKKVLPAFHYALKPEGFLLLGASESIGSFTDLFEPADKKQRIYSKKPAPARVLQLPVKKARSDRPSQVSPRNLRAPLAMDDVNGGGGEGLRAELNAQREADRITANQFAPPGVLINSELQILQFRGATGAYLKPPTGKASFDLMKMAREGLMPPLRAAINKAKKENKTARKENVRVNQNGESRTVNLEVIPLKNLRARCLLILFEDAEKAGPTIPGPGEPRKGQRGSRANEGSRRVAHLESELAETRDYLQSVQEQHEAASEELQASNEEVQSANEELQSINEELETSKEELESANEELTTVNEEMAYRNVELNRLNSDLINIQTSAHLAIVLLGRDLTIRRFSAPAEKQFNLLATDIGRPFGQVRHNLIFDERSLQAASTFMVAPRPKAGRRRTDRHEKRPEGATSGTGTFPPDLERFIAEVIASVRERECELRDKAGRWYSLRVRPYLTVDNKVDGAVLVLVDINELKINEQALTGARDYAETILGTVRDPLVILDGDLRVHTANEAFYRIFKVSPAEAEGHLIFELGNNQWQIPKLRQLLEEILQRNSFFNNFEITHDFERIGRRTILLNARTLSAPNQPARILLGIEDVTEVLQFQAAARESQTRYRALIEASAQIVWTTDPSGSAEEDSPSWRAFTGQTYEQWKGFGWLDALHPDDRNRISELWQRAVAGRTSVDTEYRLRHVSGDWRWTEVRAVPAFNPDGSVREWVGMNIDVSERVRARETQAKLAAIVESSDDAIISKDLNGIITSWNKGAEQLFGYTAQEVVGQPVTVLIPPERLDEEPSILNRIRQKKPIEHYETVRRCKDGTLLEISLTVSPIVNSDGEVVGASKIARDISDRKRAEKALQGTNDELRSHGEELERFNRVAVGRELRMIELKKEVNELCQRQGQGARYSLEFEQDEKVSAS